MDIQVATAFATMTAPGSTDGYITVADNSPFFPGAEVWLINSAATLRQRAIITDLQDLDRIGVRFWPETAPIVPIYYGRSDCSAFGVGDKICQDAQPVPVDSPNFVKKSFVP